MTNDSGPKDEAVTHVKSFLGKVISPSGREAGKGGASFQAAQDAQHREGQRGQDEIGG